MKPITWLLFCGSQLLGCLCLNIRNDLAVRWLGGFLLSPSAFLLLFIPSRFAEYIISKSIFETFAVLLFFSINAVSWIVVYRYASRRSKSMHFRRLNGF